MTAPKTVLKPVWLKTLVANYSDIDYYVLQWIGGLSTSQDNIFNQLISKCGDIKRLLIFLVNIEAFSHARIYKFAQSVLMHFRTIWIVDESTTIKSPSAKRTKSILTLAGKSKYRRILSGFPVLKTPEDLYSQVQFLGSKLIPHQSFYAFRNDFTFTKQLDNRVTISIGARNVDKLQKLLQPFSSRLLKKDCLDLPEKVHTVRYVDMTTEQKSYYDKMRKEGHYQVKNSERPIFAQTLLVQLEKLHQLANGIDISSRQYFDCGKTEVLLDTIKNEIGDNQFVVWSCYVMNIHQISSALRWAGIKNGMLFGDVPLTQRVEHIENFASGKLQAIVANPSTAMHGINWPNASYAIYFNNSFHLEHRLQSEDRLHRIGQVNKVTYIDLVVDNTIEEKILDVLQMKHSVGAQALGDTWEDWFV